MSKRKEESNKKAEIVCRELRWQIANSKIDEAILFDLLLDWMKVTGKIKYEKPTVKGE